MKRIFLLLIIFSIAGCNQNNRKETADQKDAASAFVKSLEAIHNKSTWDNYKAVAFDIELSFNGEERLDAKVTSLTNSPQVRLDKKDGTKLIYNGEQVFLCPAEAEAQNAGFDIFAWQYFFALPFKLNDPGAELEVLQQQEMRGNILKRARLSFDGSTGNLPDDQYILYQESDTGLLHAASYIEELNPGNEEAEDNPYAIIYRDYIVVEGIPVSTRWTFHNWTEEEGFGEEIGEAFITNITFFDAREELFEKPENSKVIEE